MVQPSVAQPQGCPHAPSVVCPKAICSVFHLLALPTEIVMEPLDPDGAPGT